MDESVTDRLPLIIAQINMTKSRLNYQGLQIKEGIETFFWYNPLTNFFVSKFQFL